jgi:ankyrin repeat protein
LNDDSNKVIELISNNINVNQQLNQAENKIFAKEYIKTLNVVINGSENEYINEFSMSPLLIATKKGNINIVRILITAGADVNAMEPRNGYAPLFLSAVDNNLEIMKILIASGAEINTKDNYGQNILAHTINNNNLEATEILLDAGININDSINKHEVSPIIFSVSKGNSGITKKLIEYGADINIQTNDGKTALYYAIENKNEIIVNILIDESVQVDKKSRDLVATGGGNVKIRDALFRYEHSLGNGYLNAKWGMTIEQVKEALIDEEHILINERTSSDGDKYLLFKIGGSRELTCWFYNNKFYYAEYVPFPKDGDRSGVEAVLLGLKNKYGSGENITGYVDGLTGMKLLLNVWDDGVTEIKFRMYDPDVIAAYSNIIPYPSGTLKVLYTGKKLKAEKETNEMLEKMRLENEERNKRLKNIEGDL